MGDSLLEMWFGKIKWPVAALLIVVVVVVGAYNIVANDNANHLRGQIVQACANSSNAVTCAKNLTTAVNGVNQ